MVIGLGQGSKVPKVMESLRSADFILLAEFLNFSSLQTLEAIFQAAPENFDSRIAGQAWPRGTGFQGLNKGLILSVSPSFQSGNRVMKKHFTGLSPLRSLYP